jgi:hypothetical protein
MAAVGRHGEQVADRLGGIEGFGMGGVSAPGRVQALAGCLPLVSNLARCGPAFPAGTQQMGLVPLWLARLVQCSRGARRVRAAGQARHVTAGGGGSERPGLRRQGRRMP